MFAVGHLALGYLLGRTASRLLAVDAKVSYLFLFSILPDIDLLVQVFGLEHRGPTHSLVLFCVLFFPIFLTFRKRAFPYLIALAQHSVIGDLLTGGGLQLLWPLSFNWYEIGSTGITSMTNIFVEWALFLGSMLFLLRFKDASVLVRPHRSNLTLLIPLVSVSLPLLAFAMFIPGFRWVTYHVRVPTALIIPHVAFIILFTLAVLVDLKLGARIFVKRLSRAARLRARKTKTTVIVKLEVFSDCSIIAFRGD